MPTFIFNKLVRDRLRDEYVKMNQKATLKSLSKSEHSIELVNKIIEEVKEIPVDGTKAAITAELADAKQALDDLMTLHAITAEDIETVQKKKFAKKGGFAGGTYVVSLELSDDDEWVDYYRAAPDIFPEIQVDEKPIDIPLIEAGVYEHYKGKLYEVVGVGLDSETTKPVVIYVPLYETNVPFWVRSYEMFLGYVEVDGTKLKRFEKISE